MREGYTLHGRCYEGRAPLFEVPKVWEIKHFSHREDPKLLSENAQQVSILSIVASRVRMIWMMSGPK
eukprot:3575384-Prymnesium_polylepis.1